MCHSIGARKPLPVPGRFSRSMRKEAPKYPPGLRVQGHTGSPSAGVWQLMNTNRPIRLSPAAVFLVSTQFASGGSVFSGSQPRATVPVAQAIGSAGWSYVESLGGAPYLHTYANVSRTSKFGKDIEQAVRPSMNRAGAYVDLNSGITIRIGWKVRRSRNSQREFVRSRLWIAVEVDTFLGRRKPYPKSRNVQDGKLTIRS